MAISDSTRRSSSGSALSAGVQAVQVRQQGMKDKRDFYLKSYENSKKQLMSTLAQGKQAIDARFLLAKRDAKDDPTRLAAVEANYKNEIENYRSTVAGQMIKSMTQGITAPMVQLGILPSNQIESDTSLFTNTLSGLRQDQQAYIDALPKGAESAAKAEATNEMVNMISRDGSKRVAVPVTDTMAIEKFQKAGYQKQTPVSIGVQAATLEDAGMTKSQKGKEIQARLDAEEALANMKDEVGNINALLSKGGESGMAGDIFRSADSLMALASSMASMTGIGVNTSQQTSKVDIGKMFPKLAEKGVLSQEVKNSIWSLAFMVAASEGQTGKALSDKDLERVMLRLGDSSSIDQLKASLNQEVSRAERKFKNKMKIRFGVDSPEKQASDKAEQEMFQGNPVYTPQSSEEYNKLPSGAYFRDDEGIKRKP